MGKRVLITLLSVAAAAAGASALGGVFLQEPAAPTVTATMTGAIAVDQEHDGKADAGDIIRYTARGTYYVRVRAVDAAGAAGPPSAEIVIVVP